MRTADTIGWHSRRKSVPTASSAAAGADIRSAGHSQQSAFVRSRLRRQADYSGVRGLSGGLLGEAVWSTIAPRCFADLTFCRPGRPQKRQKGINPHKAILPPNPPATYKRVIGNTRAIHISFPPHHRPARVLPINPNGLSGRKNAVPGGYANEAEVATSRISEPTRPRRMRVDGA